MKTLRASRYSSAHFFSSLELDASWRSDPKVFERKIAKLLKNESRHDNAVFGWGHTSDRGTRSKRKS